MNKDEKKATRQSFGEELANIGEKNEKIVVLDADLSSATKTNIFAKKFPNRFFDMGIAEQNMIGTAAGLATCNKIPFVSTFAMFAAGRAYDQIRNSICYPKLNVKICATHAGITVGEDGATHQMLEDISLMRMASSKYKLDNLCVFIDNNNLQIDGKIEDVINPYPIDEKFESFGFKVITINGNNIPEIEEALNIAKETKGKPTVIISKTTKGKGISFMEDNASWHGKAPNEEEYKQALKELGGEANE